MKIKFNFPPRGEKDNFSHDLAEADFFFKIVGWLIVIGTLQFAATVTGHAIFTGIAFSLTLQICALAMSFVNNRIHIEFVGYEGSRPFLRRSINIIVAALVGFAAWQGAAYVVRSSADEIVAFNKRGIQSKADCHT